MISYGRQHIDAGDIRAVVSALKSPRITQGPLVDLFEKDLADYCDARYAVAVSNGTAALHLACLAAGIGAGDEVITSPISFLATSNSVIYTGAAPVFADIDYETGNISAGTIKKVITRKTKAILVVHLGGQPADMLEIHRLAKKNDLILIEDACHALGAEYHGAKVGSCRYSDMAVFSFHPVKLITTGEGGGITTNHKKFLERLKLLRSHGMRRSAFLQKKYGAWYYEMQALGFNYRLTDIQCALGISQLKKAGHFVRQRNRIADKYNRELAGLEPHVKLPQAAEGSTHARHLYLFRILAKGNFTRRKLYDFLRAHGIYAQVHYIPIYRQPYYRAHFKMKAASFPNAERYYEEAMSLPIFPDLSERESDRVVSAIKQFFKQ